MHGHTISPLASTLCANMILFEVFYLCPKLENIAEAYIKAASATEALAIAETRGLDVLYLERIA